MAREKLTVEERKRDSPERERMIVVRGRTEADRQYRTRLSSSSRARSRGPRREEEDGSEAMSSTRVRPTEAG